MSIDRDDGSERQARVDGMISEFRAAQARRSAKPDNGMVVSKHEAKKPETGPANPVADSPASTVADSIASH